MLDILGTCWLTSDWEESGLAPLLSSPRPPPSTACANSSRFFSTASQFLLTEYRLPPQQLVMAQSLLAVHSRDGIECKEYERGEDHPEKVKLSFELTNQTFIQLEILKLLFLNSKLKVCEHNRSVTQGRQLSYSLDSLFPTSNHLVDSRLLDLFVIFLNLWNGPMHTLS